jgi:hemerythrin
MQLIVWTSDMSVNVKLLDNDHRKLALLINTLHHGLVTGRAKPELEEVFNGLVKHTLVHHAHEDKLMAETAYPGTEEHTLEHDSSVKRLLVLQMRFNNSDGLADELDVMNQLKDWLLTHIQKSDRKFISFFKAQGVDPLLASWRQSDGVLPQQSAMDTAVGQTAARA